MSARAQRRRAKSSVTVKQAFVENESENKPNTQDLSDKYKSSSNGYINLDRFYEKEYFTMNNSTVEVVLNNDVLSWSEVTHKTGAIYVLASYEEIQQNQSSDSNPSTNPTSSINLYNVYAISPIYSEVHPVLNTDENSSDIQMSNVSSSPSYSPLRGFQLHSYEKLNDNVLQEILVIFQSNTPNQIKKWYRLLSKLISQCRPPRNILVLCNPYAGARHSRYVYTTNLKPMLERAHYQFTYVEIDDSYSAEEALNNFQGDFDSLDGLVVIGGDGSVINVINALLRYVAKLNRTSLNRECDLPQLPFPLCIIPNGTTNVICHSIHGCMDHCTSILHLLFNQRMKIDMSAVFDVNHNFVTANFSAGAGFPANILRYFTRYSLCSPKKTIRKSVAKAAANKNLRSIEMEIRYIPANENSTPMVRCYRGCSACAPALVEESDNRVKIFDETHMQNLPKRKAPWSPSSNDNNCNRSISLSRKFRNQNSEEQDDWETLKDDYLQVLVLTNASIWSFAPQGLSKFGHLADGFLDLVLIEPTSRKEFLRYIKRNGNSKYQFGFPFTKIVKVTEIEITLKFPCNYITNGISNMNDESNSSSSEDSSNEDYSNNENKGSSTQRYEPRPPDMPISETSRRSRRHRPRFNESVQESLKRNEYSQTELNQAMTDSFNGNISTRRRSIFHSLKLKKDKTFLPRPTSFDADQIVDEKQNRKGQRLPSAPLRSAKSLLNLFTRGSSSSEKIGQSLNLMQDSSNSTPKTRGARRSSIMSRSSVISQSSSKENEKLPAQVNGQYRNKKQPCMWNLDFTPYNSPLIRIKCFHRYLPVFGVGISPETSLREITYSCL